MGRDWGCRYKLLSIGRINNKALLYNIHKELYSTFCDSDLEDELIVAGEGGTGGSDE